MRTYPMSHCAREIEKLAGNVIEGNEVRLLKFDDAGRRI
jgi:hypothetical protein